MSETAAWTYTNIATIRPFLGRDKAGGVTYGPEYQIACTWAFENKAATTPAGVQFVTMYKVYTEDPRPKYLDQIKLATSNRWDEIKSRAGDDMSFFDESDDYVLLT